MSEMSLDPALREDQIRRYARHVLLPDVGGRGQARLLAASVAVEIGPGRAAEAVALAYLAAAGVGRIVLVGDAGGPLGEAEIGAGLLYGIRDLGRPRGEAARERIAAINPDVEVVAGAAADALRLADQLGDDDGAGQDPGAALASALVRGGQAAARLLLSIARREAT